MSLGSRRRLAGRHKPSEPASRAHEDPSRLAEQASECEKYGLWIAAITLRLKVLQLHQETLGHDHPETLTAMHLLANVYSQQEQLGEALELYRGAMLGRQRIVGGLHLDTIESTICLAATYHQQGRLEEAMPLYEQSVLAYERALGRSDPKTLGTIHQLAFCCVELGQLKRAEELYLLILPSCKEALGPSDPETVAITRELSDVYQGQGKWDEVKLLETGLSTALRQNIGKTDRSTVANQAALGHSYHQERGHGWESASSPPVVALSNGKAVGQGYEPHDQGTVVEPGDRSSDKRNMDNPKYLGIAGPSLADNRPAAIHTSSISNQNTRNPHSSAPTIIGTTTSFEGPFKHLLGPGWPDMTGKINLPRISEAVVLDGPHGGVGTNIIYDRPPVAIKCLRPCSDRKRNGIHFLVREICNISKFEHPNVLQPMGLGTFGGQVPMVSPRVKTGTLRDYASKNCEGNRLSLRLQVAEALAYTHQEKMMHGNLKATQLRHSCTTEENNYSEDDPLEEILSQLEYRGGQDVTRDLDLSRCTCPTGGFREVWQGKLRDGTRVAIKGLKLVKEESYKRTARELYCWSKATHPNILPLIGLAVLDDQLATISPWMLHGSIANYITQVPPIDRWGYSVQVAEGLTYLHSIGMIHGDIKGENILVSDEGVVKISDFGTSILQQSTFTFSETNLDGGTLRWMAPELFEEGSQTSMQADVYALGMTILEIVTGRSPYSEIEYEPVVVQKIVDGQPPQRPPEFMNSTWWANHGWDMLLWCWMVNPRNRPTAHRVQEMVTEINSKEILM